MISLSIRRKIMGIAIVLIVLMAVTAVLSMASVIQVCDQLEELARGYIPAYGNLARGHSRPNDVAAIRAGLTQKVVSSRAKSNQHASLSAS
jgi:hypothetical protein